MAMTASTIRRIKKMKKNNITLTANLWPRLRALAKKRGPRAVAVPFVSTGAAKRLPLRKGDLLVVRFDDAAIKAGLTDPKEIVAFINRGVEVHNVSNLHAKVYIMGGRAIVCSANVSSMSEKYLVEAGVELADGTGVRQWRRFVEGLRGDVIELKFAQSRVPLYRPPKFDATARRTSRRKGEPRVKQSELVAIGLKRVDLDEFALDAVEKVRAEGRKRLSNPRRFTVDDFSWHGRGADTFKKGQRVLPIFKERRGVFVYPPARVIAVRRYSVGTRQRAAVAIEVRKRLRPKPLKSVITRLGGGGPSLARVSRRRIIDATVVYRLGQLWPSA